MRSTRLIFLAVLSCAVLALPLFAGVERHVLSNGLPVLVERRPDTRVVSVAVVVDAGTKRDPAGLEGLSWVTSEVLGQGSLEMGREEMAAFMESRAIEMRRGSIKDVAYAGVRTGPASFEDAIEVLRAMVVEPLLSEEAIVAQVERTREKVASGETDDFERTYSQLLSLLFTDHPYGYTVGTRKGLEAVTRDAVVDFHARHYTVENSVIVVVGDVRDGFLDVVETGFAEYPRGSKELRDIPEISYRGPKNLTFHMDAEWGRAQLGFLAPPAGAPDAAVMSVIEALLGTGSRARIKAELDERYCGECVAFYHPLVESGLFVVHASADDPRATLAMLEREIERLKTEPVPEDELSRAKARRAGAMAILGETGLDRALLLGLYEVAGVGSSYHDELAALVGRVGVDDVMRAARKYLVEGSAVIMLPGKPRGRGV